MFSGWFGGNKESEKPKDTSPAASCPSPAIGKSGKKICCSCPDTKQVRDECLVMKGESACADAIEAHKVCLRAEGFTVA